MSKTEQVSCCHWSYQKLNYVLVVSSLTTHIFQSIIHLPMFKEPFFFLFKRIGDWILELKFLFLIWRRFFNSVFLFFLREKADKTKKKKEKKDGRWIDGERSIHHVKMVDFGWKMKNEIKKMKNISIFCFKEKNSPLF